MSFHLYRINEVYSSADGALQFVEMSIGGSNNEGFWAGKTLTFTSGNVVNSFTFPSNLPSQTTANTKVLIATQQFADLGIVSPDFIIPANFLLSSGTLNFASVDSIVYSQLPSNGSQSIDSSGLTRTASPTNFSGASATLSLISGDGGNNTLTGGNGNDVLVGATGNDTIDGGSGADIALYLASRGNYTLSKGTGSYSISDTIGTDGSDTLLNIERLQFSDTKLAIDLDGNAGTTAKILGAVGGAAAVDIAEYVGIGLELLDAGMSYTTLMQLALNAKLGAGFSNAAEVNLLYQNIAGVLPSAADLAYWTGVLDAGTFTQASLAVIAADLDLNKANVDLVGLQQTGLEYA